MSVINKMLLELEQRQSEQALFGAGQEQLRGVPSRRRFGAAHWLFAALVAGGGAAAMLMLLQDSSHQAQIIAAAEPQVMQPTAPAIATASADVAAEKMTLSAQAKAPIVTSPVIEAAAGPESVFHAEALVPVTMVAAAHTSPMPRPAKTAAPDTRPVEPATAASARTPDEEGTSARTATPRPVTPNPTKTSATMPARETDDTLGKQITELTPQQKAENEYRRASALIHQARLGEALNLLDHALELDPGHWGALQAMVGILIETRRHDEAIRRLQSRIVADRAQASLAMMLARLQVDKGDIRGAIDTLYKTSPHAAQRADYQAFLAALYQREGLHKDAVDRYMLALEKSPQNGLWWMGLGMSLQAQNRVTEARDAYLQARDSSVLSAELQEFVEQRLRQIR